MSLAHVHFHLGRLKTSTLTVMDVKSADKLDICILRNWNLRLAQALDLQT